MDGFRPCEFSTGCGYEVCVPEFCDAYAPKIETNADRIRAMTDEELGDLLRGLCKNAESCDFCPMHDSCPEGSYDLKPWQEWLQQPCEGSPTVEK